MDSEDAWKELAAAALLGTDRRGFAPPTTAGALGALLAGLGAREPEKALLGAAAALAVYRKAGRRPAAGAAPTIEPAWDDDLPRCSPASAAHLDSMLGGDRRAVLPECLAALDAAGRRAPEEFLPGLLDLGRADESLRPAILAAIGRRGAWLARQNPDWAYAAGADSPAPDEAESDPLWETGTADRRRELLGRLRRSAPDRARALVASTWDVDDPSDRAAFVAGFAAGLGPDDEPFLEAALDDRRKEVRAAAADLLARLPGSGLVRRMIERVGPRIRPTTRPPLVVDEAAARALFTPSGSFCEDDDGPTSLAAMSRGRLPLPRLPDRIRGAIYLDVALPKECDKGMIRDGIEPRPRDSAMGERAWWLSQMLGRIPPSTWSTAWGRPPSELAEAAVRGKWGEVIYPALVEAALRFGEFDWFEALAPHRRVAGKSVDFLAHVAALPPGRREAVVLKLVRAEDAEVRIRVAVEPLTDDQMAAIRLAPSPWGDELARLVLDRLPMSLADPTRIDEALVEFLKVAALCLPPDPEPAAGIRRTARDGSMTGYFLQLIDRHLDEFHDLLRFRQDMLRELCS